MKALKPLSQALFLHIVTVPQHRDLTDDIKPTWNLHTRGELPYDTVGGYYPEFGKVVCITIGRKDADDTLKIKQYVGEERQILEQFNHDVDVVMTKQPTVYFAGADINTHTLPYLYKRMVVHGINPYHVFDTSVSKPWDTTHSDIAQLWQGASYNKVSIPVMAYMFGMPFYQIYNDKNVAAALYYNGHIDTIQYIGIVEVTTVFNLFVILDGCRNCQSPYMGTEVALIDAVVQKMYAPKRTVKKTKTESK